MNLQRRLNNTYQKLYRHRHIIAKKLKLSDPEYRLWDLYLALYDWDTKHTETFQTVEAPDRDIAKLLDWSASKVCRNRNKLISKGIIKSKTRTVHEVILIPSKETDVSSLQHQNAPVKQTFAGVQQKSAEKQQSTGKTDQNTIVSYKDKYIGESKRVVIKQEVRSDKEYQRIYQGGDFQNLTPDDMKWIDENLSEIKVIEDNKMENDIVDIYFDGDWGKYKQSLITKH